MQKMFVLKKEDVTGGWRKFNKAELRDLYHGKTLVLRQTEHEWDGQSMWNECKER
jgi:hypothetical protein